MATYSQPKMDELRQQYIENIRNEVQRSTMEKLQQQADAEAAGLNKFSSKILLVFFFFS